jgi:beta-phosphoglucomutase-like phosphatase (HAD superfamily)
MMVMQTENPPLILLCDLDGTLVDSNAHLSQCVADLLTGYGIPFSTRQFFEPQRFTAANGEARHTPLYGGTWNDVYEFALDKSAQNIGHDAFFETVENLVNRPGVVTPPRAGMVESLQALHAWARQDGIALVLAAVTNGKAKEAARNIAVMQAHGFDFPVIVTADDPELNGRGKPHPDPYLLAYRRLSALLGDVAPVAITLEDSIPGHQAALAMAEQTPHTFCFYLPHYQGREARHALEKVLMDVGCLPEEIMQLYQPLNLSLSANGTGGR